MLTFVTFLISFLHLLLSIPAAQNCPPYSPTEIILLDCGAQSTTTSLDGRNWDADADHSKFSAPNRENSSFVSTASSQESSVIGVPYKTARIFRSEFIYKFPVSPGPKFLRLYFYSAEYSGLNITTAFFSVNANNYTLLSNFSVYLTASATSPRVPYVIKEFVITVWDNQMLNLTFNPFPNSYAFINGIEIVSMPGSLYMDGDDNQLTLVGSSYLVVLQNTTNLETLYRLNVGGSEIGNTEDTGMFRTWHQDDDYINAGRFGTEQSFLNDSIRYTPETPAYVAPVNVYATVRSMSVDSRINLNYNLTWIFPVDVQFYYLVRLHFCENEDTTKANQRVFNIFINNQIAEETFDVFQRTGGSGIPTYGDYVAFATRNELWLDLHPDMLSVPKFADAILNGIEIFKLNNSQGVLAGPNPDPLATPTSTEQDPNSQSSSRNKKSRILPILGAVLGAVILISVLTGCFIFRIFSEKFANSSSRALPNSDICRHFSLREIETATSNFDRNFIIGRGGFGDVYKGFINGGSTPVAIKRLIPGSKQGMLEFRTEIELLSQLRHRNLVSLIGYCEDENEMILVYDYMVHGTLRDHLYSTNNPQLVWEQRLRICIGASRGIQYLHTGPNHTIIHRDVKTTNILLDEKWVAKVSDFGLSKMNDMSNTHISTAVKGSFRYLDPEYCRLQQLTVKSDVYSFGVVLCEVLCARAPIDRTGDRMQKSLAQWAQHCYSNGTIDQIVDPFLQGKISTQSLSKFIEVAISCLASNGNKRPAMSEVVCGLELALQLQESEINANGNPASDSTVNDYHVLFTSGSGSMNVGR